MDAITYVQADSVGIITINRPEALNALNSAVLDELDALLDRLNDEVRSKNDAARCLIVTGAGERAFVAGADIAQMERLDKAAAIAFAQKGDAVFSKLESMPIPVIAAVNGFALGGGCELAMSCDIRICSENAVFGQPETGLGILPGFGGTQRLTRLVGMGMAKQLLFTAQSIQAGEALRIQLVNAVYPREALMDAAHALAARIAKNAPVAVRYCKRAANEGADMRLADGLQLEASLFGACFETQDQRDGMRAFLEKRKVERYLNR